MATMLADVSCEKMDCRSLAPVLLSGMAAEGLRSTAKSATRTKAMWMIVSVARALGMKAFSSHMIIRQMTDIAAKAR